MLIEPPQQFILNRNLSAMYSMVPPTTTTASDDSDLNDEDDLMIQTGI